MNEQLKISIIIPAFNEEKKIQEVINSIIQLRVNDEIIVVDDGSTDNTYELAKKTGVQVIHHPYNKGYGAAIKTGIRNASGDVLLFIDADGQHKAEDIEKVIAPIQEYDMVVGARSKNSKVSYFRCFGKKIMKTYASYLAGMKIPDLNSGLRAVKKDLALEFMHLYPNGFSLTTTMTMASIFSGHSIKFVSIDTEERVGKSKIKPFSDGVNFILLTIRTTMLFNPLKVFLPISIILFLIGSAVLINDIIFYFHITSSTMLIWIASLFTFFFGLLADQMANIRLGMK
jgi:glycosyltransferase involved in cell wall biosynthesis